MRKGHAATDALYQLARIAKIVRVELHHAPPDRFEPGPPRHVGTPLSRRGPVIVALVFEHEIPLLDPQIRASDELAEPIGHIVIDADVRRAVQPEDGSQTRLGRVGKSGCAQGTHVHVEVWRGFPWASGSYRVDPWKYINSGTWLPYRYR